MSKRDTSVEQRAASASNILHGYLHRCMSHGWGAQCNEILTEGRWSLQESCHHINGRELKAALLAIKPFLLPQPTPPQHIGLMMANSKAVAYINRRGGTRSAMSAHLAIELWTRCPRTGS